MRQKRSDQVKKKRNISQYSIGAFESYLSDMAGQGLNLNKLTRRHFIFTKGVPCQQEYRVEIEKGSLTGKKDALYKERGWKRVTGYGGVTVFCADSDSDYQEVYETPKEQVKTLQGAVSILRRSLIAMSFSMIFMIFYLAVYFNIGGTPVLNLLNDGIFLFAEVFFIVVLAGLVVKEFRILKQCQNKLKSGQPINHHEKWEQFNHPNWFVLVVSAITIGCSVISIGYNIHSIYIQVNDQDVHVLTTDTELDFKTVRLNDIEQYEAPELYNGPDNSDYEMFNSVSEEKRILLEKYVIEETLLISDETYEGETYQPSLSTIYYDVKIPFLAASVAKDAIYEKTDFYLEEDSVEVKEIDDANLDKVYYVEDSDYGFGTTIVVQKDNIVVSYTYYGKHSVDDVLEAISKAFE